MANPMKDLPAVVAAARRVKRETGIAARSLLAIALVESACVPFAVFDGRREPLIRFEGHYFDRLLSAPHRLVARKAGLASPKAGAVRNPSAPSARWRLLERAAAIDPAAAFSSTSWGLGQVMGAHWRRLAYADAEGLAAEARASVDGQLRLVAKFLRIEGLDRLLAVGALEDFARRYNGPNHARNGYRAKIEAALSRAATLLASPAAPAAAPPSAAPTSPAPARPAPTGPAATGWSRLMAGLSKLVLWSFLHHSTRAPTRSFSTSTARSSDFATIPPPSGSNRASSTS